MRPFADRIRHSVCPFPFSICFPESVTPVPTRTEKGTGDDSKAPRLRAIPPRDAVFGVVFDLLGTQVPKDTMGRSASPARKVLQRPKHTTRGTPRGAWSMRRPNPAGLHVGGLFACFLSRRGLCSLPLPSRRANACRGQPEGGRGPRAQGD